MIRSFCIQSSYNRLNTFNCSPSPTYRHTLWLNPTRALSMADIPMNDSSNGQALINSNSAGELASSTSLNPTPSLPPQAPTQSNGKHSRSRSNSEVDELASSSSDSDLSDADSESHRPLASRTATTTTTQGGGGGATSLGGAIAGPGPSSSLKRSLPPASSSSRASSAQPLPPPAKKKRGRASAVNTLPNSYFDPVPLPHYTVHRVPDNQNSKTKRHVIKINADVTDGSKTRWPLEKEFDPNHKAPKREGDTPTPNWYERPDKTAPRHKNALDKIGDELSKKLGLNKTTSRA